MTTPTRIYVVTNRQTDAQRLVRAANQASAIRHESIKPVRAGEYLTRLGPSAVLPTMMLWDGQCWRYIDGMLAKWPGHQRGTEWRGLAIYHVAKRFTARPMSAIEIARLPEGTDIEEASATQRELPDPGDSA